MLKIARVAPRLGSQFGGLMHPAPKFLSTSVADKMKVQVIKDDVRYKEVFDTEEHGKTWADLLKFIGITDYSVNLEEALGKEQDWEVRLERVMTNEADHAEAVSAAAARIEQQVMAVEEAQDAVESAKEDLYKEALSIVHAKEEALSIVHAMEEQGRKDYEDWVAHGRSKWLAAQKEKKEKEDKIRTAITDPSYVDKKIRDQLKAMNNTKGLGLGGYQGYVKMFTPSRRTVSPPIATSCVKEGVNSPTNEPAGKAAGK